MPNDSTFPEGAELIDPHRFMPPYYDGFEREDAEDEKPSAAVTHPPRSCAVPVLSVEARDDEARALLKRCTNRDEGALKKFRQLMRDYIEAQARRWLSPYYPADVGRKSKKDGDAGGGPSLLDLNVRVVVNETLFEVWKQAGSFRGESNVAGGKRPLVTTWMWPIIRSTSLSFLKDDGKFVKDKSGQSVKFVCADDVETQLKAVPDPSPTPMEVLLNREQHLAILSFKRQLSFDHQEVLNLVYGEGMSCAEVAELLQIPAGTVQTRLFHARKKLGVFLKAGGDEK